MAMLPLRALSPDEAEPPLELELSSEPHAATPPARASERSGDQEVMGSHRFRHSQWSGPSLLRTCGRVVKRV